MTPRYPTHDEVLAGHVLDDELIGSAPKVGVGQVLAAHAQKPQGTGLWGRRRGVRGVRRRSGHSSGTDPRRMANIKWILLRRGSRQWLLGGNRTVPYRTCRTDDDRSCVPARNSGSLAMSWGASSDRYLRGRGEIGDRKEWSAQRGRERTG